MCNAALTCWGPQWGYLGDRPVPGETEAKLVQMMVWAFCLPGLLVMTSCRVADCYHWAGGKEVNDVGLSGPSIPRGP